MAVQDGYGKSSGSESLVFAYDLKDTVNSYRGEPTTNLVATVASYYGGNVSTSYANGQYQTSAIVINGVDNTIPSGNFSQVSGTTTDTNSQTYWTIQGNAVVNESNQTVSFSVYLKGSGTCHLATYNDQCCYQLGPDITLTSSWVRYTITKSLTTFVDYHWVAVRGITTSTNVFISSAQWERNSHSTPFTTTSRSNTQGLLDLTGNNIIDLSNVSFNSDAKIIFDETNDYINVGDTSQTDFGTGNFSVECVVYIDPNITVNIGHFKGIVVKKGASGANAGFGIYYNTGYSRFLWSTADGASSVERFTVNTWGGLVGKYVHVVMVRDSSATNQGHFYINGVYESITSGGPIMNVNSDFNLTIGASSTLFGNYFFNGDIPVVKMYNRALTSTEITNNYLKYKRQYGLT
jgi:hypothetical protein